MNLGLDKVNNAKESNSAYAKNADLAKLVVKNAEYREIDINKAEGKAKRYLIDITFEIAASSNGNNPGDLVRESFFFPVGEFMSEKEVEVKSSIMKRLFTSFGIAKIKEGTSGPNIAKGFIGKQIKAAIGLRQDFLVDKENNNKPKLFTSVYVKYHSHVDEQLTSKISELEKPEPMSSYKQNQYNSKLAFYEENFGSAETSAAGKETPDDLPFDDDEDPFKM